MILEMRTYVLKPGMTHNFVEGFAEGLTARLQFSKLLGLWLSEVGGLNRVVHVWPYESFENRERIGAEAADDPLPFVSLHAPEAKSIVRLDGVQAAASKT